MPTVTITDNSSAINSVFWDGNQKFPVSVYLTGYTDDPTPSFSAAEEINSAPLSEALNLLTVINVTDLLAGKTYEENGKTWLTFSDSESSVNFSVLIKVRTTANISTLTSSTEFTIDGIRIELSDGSFIDAEGTIKATLDGGVKSATLNSIRIGEGGEAQTDALKLTGSISMNASGWSGTFTTAEAFSQEEIVPIASGYAYLEKFTSGTFKEPVNFTLNDQGMTFTNNPAITSIKEGLRQFVYTDQSTISIDKFSVITTDIFTTSFTNIVGLNLKTVAPNGLKAFLLAGDTPITITQNGASTVAYPNFVDGADGNDSITGSAGNDYLFGGSGNDTLKGGKGDDELVGSSGNNFISGEAGNDFITGITGNDSISGGDGNDTILGGSGNDFSPTSDFSRDIIDGGLGNDVLMMILNKNQVAISKTDDKSFELVTNYLTYSAKISNVEIIKFSDVDFNVSSELNKTNDELKNLGIGTSAADSFTNVTFVNAGGGNDTLTGTSSDDTLLGGDGADSLDGSVGNDVLNGGAGIDSMTGGSGNDIYLVDSTDVINEAENNGWDQVYTTIADFKLGTNAEIEFVRFGGMDEFADIASSAAFSATGNKYRQEIFGNAAANKLSGGDGNDFISAYAGNDTLQGDAGDDGLYGATGNDSLAGGAGNDVSFHFLGWNAFNSSFAESIKGGGSPLSADFFEKNIFSGGADTFNGGDGNDDTVAVFGSESDFSYTKKDNQLVISKNGESVRLSGVEWVAFQTTLNNSNFDDLFDLLADANLVSVNDLLAGAASDGNDTLFKHGSGEIIDGKFTLTNGYDGAMFTIDGGVGNDVIFGTDVEYSISTSVGERPTGDTLLGGAGNDSLVGFDGADYLDGGTGNDTMEGGNGFDLYIVDSVGDVIIGEDQASSEADNGSSPAVQVKGNITYKIADDQYITYLTAGEFDGKAYITGSDFVFTFTNTTTAGITGNQFSQSIEGNAGANTLMGKGGSDSLWGAAGDDILDGGDDNDQLDGGLGNDSVNGGAGDDWIWGDFGEANSTRTVWTAGGKDTLIGGAGNDVVAMRLSQTDYTVSRSDTSLILTNVNDPSSITTIDRTETNGVEFIRFYDFTLNDFGEYIGLNDLLAEAASSGNDNLYKMGSGNFSDGTFTPNDSYTGEAFSINGGDGNDKIFGTQVNFDAVAETVDDSLLGGAGNDELNGLAGNDVLDGGTGNDTMAGGLGNDRYFVDNADDIIIELVSDNNEFQQALSFGNYNDAVIVSAKNYKLGVGVAVEDMIAAGTATGLSGTDAAVDMTGNSLSQGLIGNAAANKLDGGAGNDGLFGLAGNDSLVGGLGDDYLLGGTGNDTLEGGAGDDGFAFDWDVGEGSDFFYQPATFVGTGGSDTMDGGDGNDTIHLSGSKLDYTITRISDSDYKITTSRSAEVATIRNIENIVFNVTAGDLEDTAKWSSFTFKSLGIVSEFADDIAPIDSTDSFNRKTGGGNDRLMGSDVADQLEGEEGNDTLIGAGGNDTLIGGAGDDMLIISWTKATELSGMNMNVIMNGGADNDTYILDGIGMNESITVVDSGGTADILRINSYNWSNDNTAFVNGKTNKLELYATTENLVGDSWEEVWSVNPIFSVATSTFEIVQVRDYNSETNPSQLTNSLEYNIVYATLDSKTGFWTAKGDAKTSLNDVLVATTGSANIFDGGKGDDVVQINPHSASVAQGGEGFNKIFVVEGLNVDEAAGGGVFGKTVFSIGTLSYAWSTGNVEVNMAARVGIAYDAKAEEVLAFDEFYGFANIVGGKGNDQIIGDSWDNRLDGGGGSDTLAGGTGFDILIGGAGDDTYLVDLENDHIIASERLAPETIGFDTKNFDMLLSGGKDATGVDKLVISGFNNFSDISFSVGNSTVSIGLTQTDPVTQVTTDPYYTVLADKGIEQVVFDNGIVASATYTTNWSNLGTKAADFVIAKSSGGLALGGLGDDLIVGGAGRDVLMGGVGNDILLGSGNSDRLLGNAGNDTIYINRADGDIAIGGAGSDVFVIQGLSASSQNQTSRILDFKLNEDYLRFEGVAGVNISVQGMNGAIFTGQTGNVTDATKVLNFELESGYLNTSGSDNNDLQLVSLVGVDTQAELNALMSRILIV